MAEPSVLDTRRAREFPRVAEAEDESLSAWHRIVQDMKSRYDCPSRRVTRQQQIYSCSPRGRVYRTPCMKETLGCPMMEILSQLWDVLRHA
jgi:hypothetical protein